MTVERWQERWQHVLMAPGKYLPAWAATSAASLTARVHRLESQVEPTSLCHFDIRNDNLLLTSHGEVVIIDWGMARLGPEWVDLALLAVQLPTPTLGDALLGGSLSSADSRVVTDFFIAFAGSQSWNAQQPAPPGLPAMPSYCAGDARRLWRLAERRLSRE